MNETECQELACKILNAVNPKLRAGVDFPGCIVVHVPNREEVTLWSGTVNKMYGTSEYDALGNPTDWGYESKTLASDTRDPSAVAGYVCEAIARYVESHP